MRVGNISVEQYLVYMQKRKKRAGEKRQRDRKSERKRNNVWHSVS